MTNSLITQVRSLPRPLAISLAVFGGGLLWAYWPTLGELAQRCSKDAQYSHGYLVPAFALVLLWLRRERLETVTFGFRWWGVPLFVVGAMVRLAGTYLYNDWLDALSLLPCLAGVAVL